MRRHEPQAGAIMAFSGSRRALLSLRSTPPGNTGCGGGRVDRAGILQGIAPDEPIRALRGRERPIAEFAKAKVAGMLVRFLIGGGIVEVRENQ